MATNSTELLTKKEAAEDLRICIRTIENFMRARRIAYIRFGRAVRIERAEIERLKQSLTVEAI